MQQVQSTAGAFAAILADGSVATWGNQLWGGNSSAVQDQLRNVQQLQAALYGFAALPVGTSIYSSALTGDREWSNSDVLNSYILILILTIFIQSRAKIALVLAQISYIYT